MIRWRSLIVALLLWAVAPAPFAVEERYGYDLEGRLSEQVTEGSRTLYRYDAAGNLLEVQPGLAAEPPIVDTIDGAVLRIGDTATVALDGSGLEGAYVIPNDTCLAISNLSYTASGLTFDVNGDECTETGIYTLTLITPAGTLVIEINLAPTLPQLLVTPTPIAIPPGAPYGLAIRLSSADSIPHTVQLVVADSSVASVTPITVTFAPGEKQHTVTLIPAGIGQTRLDLTAPGLAPFAVPIYVGEGFTGRNASLATPVGVVVEQPEPPPVSITRPLFTAMTGVVHGGAITGIEPARLAIGTGPTLVEIHGHGLAAVDNLAIEPSDGLTLGAWQHDPTSGQITVPVTVAEEAPATLRRVIVSTPNGELLPTPVGADRLRITLPPPVLESVTPIVLQPGATARSLTLRGRHLSGLLAVHATPSQGLVLGVPQASSDGSRIDLQINVALDAMAGRRVLIVETEGGVTDTDPTPHNSLEIALDIEAEFENLMGTAVGVVKTVPDEPPPPPVTLPFWSGQVGVVFGGHVAGMAPLRGVIGTAVDLVIEGAGLAAVDSVEFAPGDGIAVGAPVAAGDGTRVTVPLVIAADAPTVLHQVRVFADGAEVMALDPNANRFLVTLPPPVIESVWPQHLAAGTTTTLQVRGSNLDRLETFQLLPGDGTAVTSVTVAATGTELTAQVAVAADAPEGLHVVQAVTAGGASDPTPSPGNTVEVTAQPIVTYPDMTSVAVGVVLTVESPPEPPPPVTALYALPVGVEIAQLPPPPQSFDLPLFTETAVGVALGPVATRLLPDALLPGETQALTLIGHGLDAVATLTLDPPENVTVTDLVVGADGQTLDFTLYADAAAAPGRRRVVLQDAGGAAIPFADAARGVVWVGHGMPRIDSIEPILAGLGDAVTLLVRGVNLNDAQRVRAEPPDGLLFGSPYTINADGTELRIPLAIVGTAPLGPRVIRVEVPGAVTTATPEPANTFTVFDAVP